jgi:DNA polymerase-3 subunit beta
MLPIGDDVLVPKKGLNEVAKFLDIEGDVQIGIKNSNFIVKKEKETIIIRMLEGEFPQYEELLNKGDNHLILLNKVEFGKMLKRMSILATDNYKGAVFTFNDDKLVITATNPDYGESKEDMEITFSGEPIEVAFNPKFFLDTLSVIDEENVIVNIVDGSLPCVVEGDTDKTFISVIMPMRI